MIPLCSAVAKYSDARVLSWLPYVPPRNADDSPNGSWGCLSRHGGLLGHFEVGSAVICNRSLSASVRRSDPRRSRPRLRRAAVFFHTIWRSVPATSPRRRTGGDPATASPTTSDEHHHSRLHKLSECHCWSCRGLQPGGYGPASRSAVTRRHRPRLAPRASLNDPPLHQLAQPQRTGPSTTRTRQPRKRCLTRH